MIMAREASVQLCYQNVKAIYEYNNPPMIELRYRSHATAFWITNIIFQIVSLMLSALSTLSPTLTKFQLSYYEKFRKPPTTWAYLAKESGKIQPRVEIKINFLY